MYLSTQLQRKVSASILASLFAASLLGCGGGDSTTSTTSDKGTTPAKPDGITYTAFTVDRVGSGSLTFDIDGGLKVDNTTYTLVTPSGSECSITSNPANPPNPACSPLAEGEGYLLCDNTTGESFDTVLFKSSVVEANIAELLGKTLKAVSCGTQTLRETGTTLTVNAADGSLLQTFTGGSTSTWTYPYLGEMLANTGAPYFDWRYRFAVRKMVQTNKTTYFLMELFELTNAGSQNNMLPRIYTVEVPVGT